MDQSESKNTYNVIRGARFEPMPISLYSPVWSIVTVIYNMQLYSCSKGGGLLDIRLQYDVIGEEINSWTEYGILV